MSAPLLRSRAVVATSVVALALSAIAILTSTDAVAQWMSHPARVGPNGELPATTLDGAKLTRLALLIMPWLGVGLVALLWGSERRRSVSTPLSPASSRSLLLLVGIMAVGLLLRAPLLQQSLWYDEIVPFGGYSVLGPGDVIGNYYSQANHVFSQLLLWCSTALFGVDEVTLRLPAFIASMVAIAAVFQAVRRVADERSALFAASAMAILPLAVLAGTDARGYAIAIGCVSVALWALAAAATAANDERRIAAWIAFAAALALGVWAHMVTVVAALAIGVLCVIRLFRRDDRSVPRSGLVALTLAGVMTLLLYAPILPDLIALRSQFGAHSASVPSLVGPESWHALLGLGGAWTWWAAIPGALLALIGLPTILRRSMSRAPVSIRTLIASGLLAFGLTFLLAALAQSWLYARFLVFTLPSVAILIAAGCAMLEARRRFVGVSAIVILTLVSAADLWTLPPRQPLREALAMATTTAPAGARVAVVGLNDNPLAYYALVGGVELIDYGNRGARLTETALTAQRPAAVIILYPRTQPAAVFETLGNRGYAHVATLDGWIDWGAGQIDVYALPR